MTLTTSPVSSTPAIPDPESIRAAIKSADERARLLRRLLRLAIRLQLHLTTADQLLTAGPVVIADPGSTGQGVARG